MKNSTAYKYLLLIAALLSVVGYIVFGTDVHVLVKASAVLVMFACMLFMAWRMAKASQRDTANAEANGKFVAQTIVKDPMPDWGLVVLGIGCIVSQLIIAVFLDRPYWSSLILIGISIGTFIGVTFFMDRVIKLRDPFAFGLDQAPWKRAMLAVISAGAIMLLVAFLFEAFWKVAELDHGTAFGANLYLSWVTAACLNVLLKRRKTAKKQAQPLQASAPSQ